MKKNMSLDEVVEHWNVSDNLPREWGMPWAYNSLSISARERVLCNIYEKLIQILSTSSRDFNLASMEKRMELIQKHAIDAMSSVRFAETLRRDPEIDMIAHEAEWLDEDAFTQNNHPTTCVESAVN